MEKLKKYLPLVAVILAVVAIAMIFLPCSKGNDDWKGFNAVFGYSMSAFGMTVNVFEFSFMNLLTYVLVIVGLVCAAMAAKKDNIIVNIVGAVCLLVAGIFFFMTPNFIVVTGGGSAEGLELGTGPIIAAICSILAAVCVAVPAVLKKLGK